MTSRSNLSFWKMLKTKDFIWINTLVMVGSEIMGLFELFFSDGIFSYFRYSQLYYSGFILGCWHRLIFWHVLEFFFLIKWRISNMQKYKQKIVQWFPVYSLPSPSSSACGHTCPIHTHLLLTYFMAEPGHPSSSSINILVSSSKR